MTVTETQRFLAAIACGDVDQVRQLLDDEPALISQPSATGGSVAIAALIAGHPGLADELAARSGELTIFEAAAFDECGRLEELILADPSAVDSYGGDGWRPLHLAARFGRAEAARALLDADAVVNEPSRNERLVYPLYSAAVGGYAELVWMLIAADADVDARESRGWTALHVAAANGDVDSIQALLSAGADPHATNNHGQSPVDLADDDTVRSTLLGSESG
jgi:ankyrin repeat protein